MLSLKTPKEMMSRDSPKEAVRGLKQENFHLLLTLSAEYAISQP